MNGTCESDSIIVGCWEEIGMAVAVLVLGAER